MKKKNIDSIGTRIGHLMIDSQIKSAQELADKSDGVFKKTAVFRWRNDITIPGGSSLIKLAEIFDTTADYILTGKEYLESKVNIPHVIRQIFKDENLPDDYKQQLTDYAEYLYTKAKEKPQKQSSSPKSRKGYAIDSLKTNDIKDQERRRHN